MAITELTNADELMLQSLYWWDIATFFRCPIERTRATAMSPSSACRTRPATEPPSATSHLGPRAVREVSAMARRVHMEFGIDPWDLARVRDMGDVPLPEANDNEACIERITRFYRAIDAAGVRPVSVGGDHSITGGIMQANRRRGRSPDRRQEGGVPALRRP